ncbi:MAG TPA: carboxymuconolactone decarboxylase family protein, partial [Chitinophagales bacterium]|nr:carboxymuconolactone decarboxylase family protein [Chitinophagales bacterium]
MHETTQEILAELGIANDYTNATLQHLSLADSKYLRDLKLNVKAVLTSEHLSAKETHLIALAIAANNNKEILVNSFAAKAKTNGASDAE